MSPLWAHDRIIGCVTGADGKPQGGVVVIAGIDGSSWQQRRVKTNLADGCYAFKKLPNAKFFILSVKDSRFQDQVGPEQVKVYLIGNAPVTNFNLTTDFPNKRVLVEQISHVLSEASSHFANLKRAQLIEQSEASHYGVFPGDYAADTVQGFRTCGILEPRDHPDVIAHFVCHVGVLAGADAGERYFSMMREAVESALDSRPSDHYGNAMSDDCNEGCSKEVRSKKRLSWVSMEKHLVTSLDLTEDSKKWKGESRYYLEFSVTLMH